ncbi:MAG: bacteriocin fulvocin C-related protein [Bacteroidota bacterium]
MHRIQTTVVGLSLVALSIALTACDGGISQAVSPTPEPSVASLLPSDHESLSCAEVSEWIDENPSVISSEVTDLYSLPKRFRMQIFNRLTPDEALSTVRQHLDYAAEASSLSDEQQVMVDLVANSLSRELYESGSPNDGQKKSAISQLKANTGSSEELQILFGDQLFHKLFVSLSNPHDELPATQTRRPPESCECNTSEDFCDNPVNGEPNSACSQDIPCDGSSIGCGWLWTARCNGGCG